VLINRKSNLLTLALVLTPSFLLKTVGPEAVRHASRLGMTCTLTDGARKFRRWRCYRSTRPHLEGPSRLKSTYSTRLAGLSMAGSGAIFCIMCMAI